jgi:hypothetical protein
MTQITDVIDFDGFAEKVERLGLRHLVDEAHSSLDFELLIQESRHANGTQGLRKAIDDSFESLGGWIKTTVGGVDWIKTNQKTRATLAVEVQVSGRSDMLAVDVIHLRDDMRSGKIDAGIIIVPNDTLSRFLTDRTPNLRTAKRHIVGRADMEPLQIVAFGHDGIGEPLPKIRTNLGKIG